MQHTVAIYRPQDIPSDAFTWEVSFAPVIQILEKLGLSPTLPQRRLHPNWREQELQDNMQIFDVVEISAQKFSDNKRQLEILGFQLWPEHEDAVSALYEARDDD